MPKHKHQRGFSLVELLIVVAIIGIIAAAGAPFWVGARCAAEQSSATASLRTMITIQQTFWLQNKRFARLDELNEFHAGGLGQYLSPTLRRGNFAFQMTPPAPSNAQLAEAFAIVVTSQCSGDFPVIITTDQTGVISKISD